MENPQLTPAGLLRDIFVKTLAYSRKTPSLRRPVS